MTHQNKDLVPETSGWGVADIIRTTFDPDQNPKTEPEADAKGGQGGTSGGTKGGMPVGG